MTKRYMQHLYQSMLLAALCCLLGGCTKGFLEKEPVGRISKDQVFREMDGVRAAMNGTYNRMAFYYTGEFMMYPDIAGDDVHLNTTGGSSDIGLALFDEHNFQSLPESEELAVGHIWLHIFAAMNNANNIINSIAGLKTMYPDRRGELDSLHGQSLVLRALCHFDLSRAYAQHYTYTADASHWGVPVLLKTPGPGEQVPRKTMRQTYDQVIKDLEDAVALLKQHTSRSAFAANHIAAWGLLSRVYLYKEDWDKAILCADSVIRLGGYALTPASSYGDMYMSGTPGREVIFQLYARKGAAQSIAGSLSAIYSSNAFQAYAASQLYNLYDAGDVRKTMFRNSGGKQYTLKYARRDGANLDWPMDPKICRLSEVYLNRAEALWRKGRYAEAALDLQEIAQRAHPESTITIVYNDAADLLGQIEAERRRELCFEGHRLFDISRRKQSVQRGGDCTAVKCGLSYPNPRFILPIPSKELDANKAMQPNPIIN
ncbi:RagB/SusD family nutrient uptake outer membrane protein [Chitinophaga horti]|uniref:RagB/SusD family nutrient uptake outer membrane protein n=1 Tax=Chitinophaga horti TaxID=2920382 RepID=A0ABY6J3X8_9BACT|nr:RagB/SusD family nutrient uptake outer membrane protein [Chitinophaga horti]UYQ94370.1 RagB/SusD family nutrient uptake outer membrane protein [Chitinophaga horti]